MLRYQFPSSFALCCCDKSGHSKPGRRKGLFCLWVVNSLPSKQTREETGAEAVGKCCSVWLPLACWALFFRTAQAGVHRDGTTHGELGLPTHQLAIKKLPHRQAEGNCLWRQQLLTGESFFPGNSVLCQVDKKEPMQPQISRKGNRGPEAQFLWTLWSFLGHPL